MACKGCMRKFFDHALETESNFPPRWLGQVLDPRDFQHVLSRTYLRRYDAQNREWGCPAQQRIYCHHPEPSGRREQCGTFLGRWIATTTCQRCEKCKAYTCLRCSAALPPVQTTAERVNIDHHCDPTLELRAREQAFAGLQRGKDYQDCPRQDCKRRVELESACNHMTCPSCGTDFCYVCGRQALEERHWTGGRCPLYGQPKIPIQQPQDDGLVAGILGGGHAQGHVGDGRQLPGLLPAHREANVYPVRRNEPADHIDDDSDEYLQYQIGLFYGDGNYDADRPGYIIGQRNEQYPAPQAPPPPDWHGLGERIGDYILQGQPARGVNLHVHEEPQRQRRAGSERLADILRGGRHVFGPARSQPQIAGGHRVDYHAQGPSNISVTTDGNSVHVHVSDYSDSSSDCHCRCNHRRCDCDSEGS
ncbi:hypothetical protein LTR10_008410 [Elasticomyces elasticus]|nr:hypothetical protein LTR10_008410 [Elasticomyces elasticus]